MAQTKYIVLDKGVSGCILVPETDLTKAVKCMNYYVDMSDGTPRELSLFEQNYCHAKYNNKEAELNALSQILGPETTDHFDRQLIVFKQELAILQKLKGKSNIVQLIEDGKFELGAWVGFIMERLPMNLYEWINDEKNKQDEYLLVHITRQLLLGMYNFQNIGVAHLDIKPQNLLFDPSQNVVKFCDFGNAQFKIPKDHRDCSPGYRAPELYHKTPFTSMEDVFLLDVWSLGCVIYELNTKKRCHPRQLIHKYDNKEFADKIAYVMIDGLEGNSNHHIILKQICVQMVTWKIHRVQVKELLDTYDKFF